MKPKPQTLQQLQANSEGRRDPNRFLDMGLVVVFLGFLHQN